MENINKFVEFINANLFNQISFADNVAKENYETTLDPIFLNA